MSPSLNRRQDVRASRSSNASATLLLRINRLIPLDLGAINFVAGVRAALACALPVLVGELSGNPHLSWIAIAGFWACLSDTGGAWNERLLAMAAFTGIAAIGCFVGTLVDPYDGLAIVFTFVWCFLCSLARVYGNAASVVGLLLSAAVLVTIGIPAAGVREALGLAGLTVIGGVWAMLLALVLWRLQPYGPARKAVALCWQALAQYAAALSHLQRSGDHDGAGWNVLASARRRGLREAIETARNIIVATRRSRAGVTAQGQRLLALLADADQVSAALIGLNELLEAASTSPAVAGVRRAVHVVLGRLAGRAEALGQMAQGAAPTQQRDVKGLIAALQKRIAVGGQQRDYVYIVELLQQVSSWIDAAFENFGQPSTSQTRQTHLMAMVEQAVTRRLRFSEILSTLRANLGFGSVAFRHALRLATTAALAVLAARAFDISRGYWISITAITVLQPYMAETWRRTFDRIAGSVLGCLIGAWLLQAVNLPLELALLIFPLSVFAFTLRSVNYAVFTLCITPLVILIAELFEGRGAGIGNTELASLRALDSIFGGLLGLLASFLFWPSWQKPQLLQQTAEALRAHRDYLLVVLGGKADVRDEDIGAARRQAGLASNNAEASLQRVLSETRLSNQADAEPVLIILACLRRMAGAIVTLSLLPQLQAGHVAQQNFQDVRRWADGALTDLARALEQKAVPAELPAAPDALMAAARLPESPFLQTPAETILWNELLRFRRQLEVLHETVKRLRVAPHALEATPPSSIT